MSKQLYMGMGLGALLLFILIGAGVYVSSNSNGEVPESGDNGFSAEVVDEFITRMRAETVERVGQPIEGFEPSMFMQAFPGLIASDFADVDALIGLYRYQDGQVMYDLNGEPELHSAARAISDEGMAQLLANVSARITYMQGEDMLEQLFTAISAGEAEEVDSEPVATGETVVVEGTITCLPHKGDGPQTMECAFGLQAVTGEYYGLSNLWSVAPDITDTNVEVEVRGEFIRPASNEKYDIVGYIDVQSVVRK